MFEMVAKHCIAHLSTFVEIDSKTLFENVIKVNLSNMLQYKLDLSTEITFDNALLLAASTHVRWTKWESILYDLKLPVLNDEFEFKMTSSKKIQRYQKMKTNRLNLEYRVGPKNLAGLDFLTFDIEYSNR